MIAEAKPPVIPFQALVLKELTFIEENADRIPDSGWINFEKMSLLGKVITTIAQQQVSPYKFNEVEPIMQYIKNPPIILNDKELLIGSRQCEPSLESPFGTLTSDRKPLSLTGGWASKQLSLRFTKGITNIRQTFRREESLSALATSTPSLPSRTSPLSKSPPSWSPWA